MPYREGPAPDQEPGAPNLDPEQTLLSVEASGLRGSNGRPGRHGSDGGASGQRGQDGGNAGRAERGQDAGSIHLLLSEAKKGVARIRGQRFEPSGGETRFDRSVAYGELGYLDLVARGGDGGHGGRGGNGGHGHRGYRGRNATRYSNGSDGGPGGNGGDAGAGSGGADGGAGGRVTVAIEERHAHLLMLLRPEVSGGAGGDPGEHGTPGQGGPGGSGGSSYSWSESESYTDSQGKRRTRTRWRRNPGGSSGPRGHSGSRPIHPIHRGQQGQDGDFRIEVGEGPLKKIYPSRYRLRLLSFTHHSENQDGIYEPGEWVRVEDPVVANVGGMPTPAHHDIELFLKSEGWLWPEEGKHLLLPRALSAGHQATLTGQHLRFQIGDYTPEGPGGPFAHHEQIYQGARLPAVSREFLDYESKNSREIGRIVVRFPVEVSPLRSLYALAPGQAARLRFSVRNISKKAFGSASALGRRLRVRLFLKDSELDDSELLFFDKDGHRASLAGGWSEEIPRLGPGETIDFEGTLALSEEAPYYRAGRVWLELSLGKIEAPGTLRPVQYRDFSVRASKRYRRDPEADLLLVTNHRTTEAEIEAWEVIASEMGFRMAIWDLSLMGHLDLSRPLGEGSLLDHFEGGTILLLDNAIEMADSGSGGELRPHTLLDRGQLLEAARRGINVALIGQGREIRELLWPTEGIEEKDRLTEGRAPSALHFLARLREREEKGEAPIDHELVELHHIGFFFETPSEARSLKRAERLSEALHARYPARRFVISVDHEPELLKSWGLIKRWRVARLRVRRSLDAAAGMLVHTSVPDARLHDPDYLISKENLLTLLLTRGVDEKLDRLAALLRTYEQAADPQGQESRERLCALVVEALLVDLVNEQRAILGPRWRRGLSGEAMIEQMPILRQLIAHEGLLSLGLLPDEPKAAHLYALIAKLTFFVESQTSLWEWLPPFYFLRRSTALRRVTKGLLEGWVGLLFPASIGVAEGQIKSALGDLEARFKEDSIGQSRGRYSQDMLIEPIASEEVTTDAERLVTPRSRVLAAEGYRAIVAEHRSEAALRQRRIEAGESEAAELLREERTEELLRASRS